MAINFNKYSGYICWKKRKRARDIIFDAIKSIRKKSKRPDTVSII